MAVIPRSNGEGPAGQLRPSPGFSAGSSAASDHKHSAVMQESARRQHATCLITSSREIRGNRAVA